MAHNLTQRGTILVKGMGEMVTYWLLSAKPSRKDPQADRPIRALKQRES